MVPLPLTDEAAHAAYVIITMKCGDGSHLCGKKELEPPPVAVWPMEPRVGASHRDRRVLT